MDSVSTESDLLVVRTQDTVGVQQQHASVPFHLNTTGGVRYPIGTRSMAMCWTDQHGRRVSLSGDSDTESLSSVSSETLAQFYTPRGASLESSDDSVTLCELEETDNLEREGFVMVENNNTSRVGDEKHGTVGGRTCDCCSHDSCAPLRRSNWCARVYELHGQPGYSMSHLECDDKLNDHLGRERSDYDYTFVEDKVRGETEYRILLRLKPGVAPLSEDEMQQLECAFLDGNLYPAAW
ncbi:hypothetical protein VFPBJ_11778 [Purpureocillium lilacinum]|uniref:Uncharacterized protein n=1 Tax=Purpureocillium lilacinum TaxID=33203 RepID=A0A179EVK1_PURLI|nr:hypothetical protein VFPBJ_11778 [Purpureocillium lilacinum]